MMNGTLAMSIVKKELEKAAKREVQRSQRRIERLSVADRSVGRFGKAETAVLDQQRNMMGRIFFDRSPEQRASDVIGRLYHSGLTPEQWNAADATERMQTLKKAQTLMSQEMMLPSEIGGKDLIAQMLDKDFVAGCEAGDAYAKLFQALSRMEQAPVLPETSVSGRSAEMLAEAEKSYESAVQRAFEKAYNGFSGEGITGRNISVEQYGAMRGLEKRLADLPRIEKEQTLEENLKECNPNYKQGRSWQINCQRCVPTYELRARGYDVTAKPLLWENDRLAFQPFSVWENAEVHTTSGDGLAEIEAFLRENGEGTRVQIIAQWKYGGGHTFVGEVIDGVVRFLDPQTDDTDVRQYFTRVRPGSVAFCRTDNLNVSDLIFDCFEEVKRS